MPVRIIACKSRLAHAIGRAVIHQGYRVLYREAHVPLEELANAAPGGTGKDFLADLTTVPLLIIDDLRMRSCHTAAEDLLEVIRRPGAPRKSAFSRCAMKRPALAYLNKAFQQVSASAVHRPTGLSAALLQVAA